jgi:ABC-type nitrate/sulfonate/bicarbonate transport system substrate-binding protein
MRAYRSLFAAAVVIAICPLNASLVAAAEKTEVRMSILTPDITSFCLTSSIARHKDAGKFSFENDNIDLRQIKVSVSQNPIVVNNGDVDIGECAGVSVLTHAWNKGAKNVVAVAVGATKPAYTIIGNKNIKNMSDLRGAKIGIPGVQSTAAEAVEMSLKRGANLLPKRDYTFIAAGGGSARVAALMAGKIEAIPTFPPFNYRLIDEGYNEVADEMDYVPKYVSGMIIVNRPWAEKNGKVLVDMLKRMIMAGDWLKDPANKDEVIAWLAKGFRVAGKPMGKKYATRYYNDVVGKGRVSYDGYADAETLMANLDILSERGYLKKDEYPPLGTLVDYRWLNQALQEMGRKPVAMLNKE